MVPRKANIILRPDILSRNTLPSVWRLSKCPKHPLPLLQSLFNGELLCQHPSSTWLSAATVGRPIKRLRGHVAAAANPG